MNIMTFFLERRVDFGQAVYFLSDIQGWRIDSAVRMTCIKANQWACRVHLVQEQIDYKYFISSYDQIENIIWEEGDNRHLKLQYMPKRISKYVKYEDDRWCQRRVIFIIFGKVDEIFIHSNIQNLQQPKKMKKHHNGPIQFFYKSVYLTLDEIQNPIYMDCYIVNKHSVEGKIGQTKFTYTYERIHQLDVDQLETIKIEDSMISPNC